MTHTQGPWRIGDAGETVFGPKTGNDKFYPIPVAFVPKSNNILLIAAAPDLLEALELLTPASFEDLPAVQKILIRKQARDAIKKARGES